MVVSRRKMSARCLRRLASSELLAILIGVLASIPIVERAIPQQKLSSDLQTEVAPRGQRAANDVRYGSWQKLCFKPGGAKTSCRTTITGKFETGQTAIRVDVIEREGDDGSRVQLFLPVGMYLHAGVKLSVD